MFVKKREKSTLIHLYIRWTFKQGGGGGGVRGGGGGGGGGAYIWGSYKRNEKIFRNGEIKRI